MPEVLFSSIVSKTWLPHHCFAYVKFQLLFNVAQDCSFSVYC